jgi:hypothetical protein
MMRPIFNYFFSDKIVEKIKSFKLPDEELRIKKSNKQGKDALIYSLTFVNILLFWG